MREEMVDVSELDPKPVPHYDESQAQDPVDDVFEIIADDDPRAAEIAEPSAEPTEAELKLQKLEAELEAMRQKADQGNRIESGFSQLGEMFQTLKKSETSKQPQAPQIDWEAKKKEWKEKFYDDPMSVLEEYTNMTAGAAFQSVQQELIETKKKLSRQELLGNENNKFIYGKYGAEVDEAAQMFPNDPDAYKKALGMVSMQHMDDIIEHRLQSKADAQAPKPQKQPALNTYSEQPSAPRPRSTNKIVIPRSKVNEFNKQFTLSPVSDKEYFYHNVWLPSQEK